MHGELFMRRVLLVLLAVLGSLGLASSGAPAKAVPSTALASGSSSASAPTAAASASAAVSEIVTFADPVLEKMVRGAMGRPEGDITREEAEAVTSLNLSYEWLRYVSDGSEIRDIGGLEFFANLECLDLSSHAITDVTPLAGLKKLAVLSICGNPVTDVTPLAGLSGLEVLMLDGCPVSSLTPLSDIYLNLIEKDFTIAFTLAELGFVMNDEKKQAIYDAGHASVRINRAGFGSPTDAWMIDCVLIIFEQNGWKIGIGYYPYTDAYTVTAYKDGNMQVNYVYDRGQDSFVCNAGDRAGTEEAVRAIFTGSDAEDVLLVPVQTFEDLLAGTLGLSAETLFEMPFDENDNSIPSPYERLGFVYQDWRAISLYEEQTPHSMNISIHRTEWDAASPPENLVDWSMEFFDSDVNGYQLSILYFAAEGKYFVSLEKDGVEAGFEIRPASGEYGAESPNADTATQMFVDAFGTDGGKWYEMPVAYFEQTVQDRFGMSIGELYALSLLG